jgi:hypothetical protein
VKYMPDLKRREPRNIGVVLATPDGWLSRFLGEGEDGEIKGNRLTHNLELDVYRTWVDYYRRKALSGSWADVERQQNRHPVNFISELGGEISGSENESWSLILDRVYGELVQERREATVPDDREPSAGTHKWVLKQARSALNLAQIPFAEKVSVPARYGDFETTVPFEFRHGVNGSTALMDAVPITSRDAAGKARELRTRIMAARDAHVTNRFLT